MLRGTQMVNLKKPESQLDHYHIEVSAFLWSCPKSAPWLSEKSLTADPCNNRGPFFNCAQTQFHHQSPWFYNMNDCEPQTIKLSLTGERITFTM